jgi:hypothetical protein
MDTWLLLLNNDLDIVLQKTIGGVGQDYGSRIHELANGNIVVAANSDSPQNTFKTEANIGLMDVWMYAVDANFNFIADQTLGTTLDDNVVDLFMDPNATNISILANSSGSAQNDKTCVGNGGYDIWGLTLNSTLQTNDIQPTTSLKVYPNPSTGVFSFEGLADLSGQLRIQVSNTYGQIVWEESITDANQQFTIESPGVYLVSILANDQMVQTVILLRY